ncbi:glycosyl transferase family 2 [Salinispora arenicola]|uniref:Glycosyl transferase family 2 n=1 Tax=Salinispora arenicola TaxID=168697 RepID=A0A542XTB4_SALAC|nr:glycosyl transferase family 2 [Salinispora arenicola]
MQTRDNGRPVSSLERNKGWWGQVESTTHGVVAREGTRPLANLTEIAIPIHNEEKVLVASIHRLRRHLQKHFPYPFVITIADNGSTDRSWELATQLAGELPDVRAIRVPVKGRGGAIRYAWTHSEATVVAYMDVDLSIDLDAFAPLVAAVMSGHSDIAIGTRYAQGSFVARSAKRAFFSRALNSLLRNVLGARFSDAMCGFKAARRESIQPILRMVTDNRWFFDPEMLLYAQRSGLRIHEVPVVCIDDPDSSVHVIRDAADDLRAMVGVARRLTGGLASPWFVAVWMLCTALYAVLYVALDRVLPMWWANALALVVAVLANTAALRTFSFGVRGAARAIRYQLATWLDFALRLVLSSMAITALFLIGASIPAPVEAAVVFGSIAIASWLLSRLLSRRGGTVEPSYGVHRR